VRTGALIALFILLAWMLMGMPGYAQTLDEAKATGWLPAWLSSDDRVRVIERKEGTTYFLYRCFEDATTGSQWVLRTRRGQDRERSEGRVAIDFSTPKKALTAAQVAVCFTAPPPITGPKAIGEPAYWMIAWGPGLYPATPNFVYMNSSQLAGPVVPGEPCGPPSATAGWYLLPRLAMQGRVPLTKCAP
jgi:hypothetical protein